MKSGWGAEPKIYKYTDLNEFEVYEEGQSIAIGRAGSDLVGGLLFGVVGAVVDGSRSKLSIALALFCSYGLELMI